jgi:peptidyl-dipeptidase A
MKRISSAAVLAVLLAVTLAAQTQHPATPEGARAFLKEANEELLRLVNAASRAGWTQSTYITPDTEIMAAQANEALVSAATRLAKEAFRFDNVQVSPEQRRQLYLLKNSLTMSAPPDPKEAEELTGLVASMEGAYGSGKFCPQPAAAPASGATPPEKDCLDVEKITEILAKSRDPKELQRVWEGWHTISPPMRKQYERFVELSNKGAKVVGFADTGAMWRSKYDMPPDAFARELDRLWAQLQPLYLSLHTYVRSRLHEKYGAIVPETGPIPAHLLGNLWQQDWSNVYDLVAPQGQAPSFDLTRILTQRKVEPLEMVRIGERFFSSLGFAPLPKTFWERSLFVKPRDREVVCHASAWNVNSVDDLRIKMCIEIRDEDFVTVHHELGHNFYQRAYNQQPFLYRAGANDGFHEAIGDAVALSITPSYLVKVGLLRTEPKAQDDVEFLLRMALDKVAFLPFGLLVDQWRWKVFSGEIAPAQYNEAWWALREKYQGVKAPGPRPANAFDPGAKYHVPANTPYTRYFLAHILQFQMHRAMCKAAGHTGPLHTCSVYGNKEVGARLQKMLAMGASKPWPEALEALTGEKQMDATAILDYFAPLREWLEAEAAK